MRCMKTISRYSRLSIVTTFAVLFFSVVAFAGLSDPEGDFAFYKNAKFSLKVDYEAYSKYFKDRDLNGYNGNSKASHPITGETYFTQTDEIEEWFEHEVRIFPKIYFNEKLEFNMRLDVGGYIWQSDIANRIDVGRSYGDSDVTVARADYEKLEVEEANLQIITPIGLFLIGRFDNTKHGLVYAIQLPHIPKWSFAAAYLMKHEGKLNTEGLYVNYMQSKNIDYLDRDDQYEAALISIYDDIEDGEGISSQQWVEYRGSDSKVPLAKNTSVYIPQWEFNFYKGKFHFHSLAATAFGTISELTKTSMADDMRNLTGLGGMLAESLQPGFLDAPDVEPKDIEVKFPVNIMFDTSYDLGKVTPQIRFYYCDGADEYNEVAGLIWDHYEPPGFRTPRLFKLLLLGEIEDKYFPLLATLGTSNAFNIDDISYSNIKGLSVNATYHMNEKWELFGQTTGLWRNKIKYYEKNYWDMFPLMYALNNMYVDSNGDTIVPLVFKRRDVDYTPDIDPFLGVEINGYLTYHLFESLDVSLLWSYFIAGDFYKDVLTPKPYKVQWVNQTTSSTVEGQGLLDLKGPYGFDDFDLENAWTIQIKVDFKFEI